MSQPSDVTSSRRPFASDWSFECNGDLSPTTGVRLEIAAVADTIWCVLDNHPQDSSWQKEFVISLQETTRGKSRLEDALAIKNRNLPKRIYKYRKCSSPYHLNALESDTVWLCSPKRYNDPYDCWFTLPDGFIATLIEQALNKRNPSANNPHFPYAATKFGNKLAVKLAKFRDLAKICSFSSCNDSVLMWSHYSEDHGGFCIEYDIEGLDPSHSFCKNLYPVVYSNDLGYLRNFVEKLVGASREEYPYMGPLLCMLVKFTGWAYENEWRIIHETPTEEDDGPMAAPVASRVFVGSQFELNKNQKLIAICKKKKIPIEQMRLGNDKFELLTKSLVITN
jgi:Protein of unknown function (DUF2971)